jgi:hypothetical protein
MKNLIIFLLIAILLIAGCAPEEPSTSFISISDMSKIEKSSKSSNAVLLFMGNYNNLSSIFIYRFTDTEKNVTCWIASGAGAEGISCLPIK